MINRRDQVRALVRLHDDPVLRATRVYLEEPSFCLGRHRDLEFAIKSLVANALDVPYRTIAIAGSAQLGFSPHSGKDFEAGSSDLDLAIIDGTLFRKLLELCINETRAFTNLGAFTHRGGKNAADQLQDYITRRGMILIKNMPLCSWVAETEQVLARASALGARTFSEVNLAVYMSETLFAWKQNSGLSKLMTRF